MELNIKSPQSVLSSISLSPKFHKIFIVWLCTHFVPAFLLKSPNSGGIQAT